MSSAPDHGGRRFAFLLAFAETGIITSACEAVGCARQTVYDWRQNDREFEQAFQEAKMIAIERLEREAVRRAREGLRRVKFYRSAPLMVPNPETGELEIYTEHEYSDNLLMFLLKAAKPDVYRDNHKVEMSAQVASKSVVDYGEQLPTPEDVRARLLQLADKFRADQAAS